MDAAKNDRATLDSAEVDVAEGDAAEGDVAEGDAAVSSVLDLTSTRVQPPRECNSLLYINDEDRQLFLYNTEMDCIKDGDRLSDNGIKFFTRYVHVDTAMLALAPNANAWFPSLDPAANHVQILHDSERMHWLLTARVNGVVYVLETLWGEDRVRCPAVVEDQIRRLYLCTEYVVLPCVQQDDAIICGYLDIAMLYHLNLGASPEEVGQLRFDPLCLNYWLAGCAEAKRMTAPVLLKEGRQTYISRVLSPKVPTKVHCLQYHAVTFYFDDRLSCCNLLSNLLYLRLWWRLW